MRRSASLCLLTALFQTFLPSAMAGEVREVRLATAGKVDAAVTDLLFPEGRSRWDLQGIETDLTISRLLDSEDATVTLTDVAGEEPAGSITFTDPTGGDAAARWILPERFRESLRPGYRDTIYLRRSTGEIVDDLRVTVETRGIGWVDLSSGPREVSLQRALVESATAGSSSFTPESLIHRWVDPRAGIVATVAGTPTTDGRGRLAVETVELVEEVITGAADLKIYIDQLITDPYTRLNYSWDTGEATAVSSLTPDAYANIGLLIDADSWAFTEDYSTGQEVASTVADVNSGETCNMNGDGTGSCGYTGPGKNLEREDINFPDTDPANITKNNQVLEREDGVDHVTFWLRAGALKEGKPGLFGNGESRFCYVSEGSETRTEVPLWKFASEDAGGWYIQPGDSWGAVFNPVAEECEQSLYNQQCGQPGLFWDELYIKTCTGGDGLVHLGEQTGEVIKGGVVTLPSGHTLNALLVRTKADYCVYTGRTCRDTGIFKNRVSEVRTFVYLWQVPYLGTVVLLQSEQDAPDARSLTTVDVTHISYGLYPPVSITVGTVTDNSIALSWDPGEHYNRIDDFKIYWDTDSGSSSQYAYNSGTHPEQVTFGTDSATISGLDSATTYFLTVTSLSTYANPSTGTPVTYESILYPTQVSGDPDHIYPVEVIADTSGGCVPTEETTWETISKVGAEVEFCWNPSSDPCKEGYEILGAADPGSSSGFAPVVEAGPAESCWTGDPSESYFLIIVAGAASDGPWGHYGL